jgi:hypothetical protein
MAHLRPLNCADDAKVPEKYARSINGAPSCVGNPTNDNVIGAMNRRHSQRLSGNRGGDGQQQQMQQHESIPTQKGVAHPKCTRCGARMFLAEIEPDEPGHDRRTFECIECGNVQTKTVKYKLVLRRVWPPLNLS